MKLIEKGKKIYSGVFIDNGLPHKKAVDLYRERRQNFFQASTCPLLLFSVDIGPGGHNIWPYVAAPIYQEPFFIWFTGLNQFPAVLFLDPQKKKEVLFLPQKNPSFEFWQGVRLGLGNEKNEQTAKAVTGIKNVLPLKDLDNFLFKWNDSNKNNPPHLGLLWYEKKAEGKNKKKLIKDSNWIQGEKIKRDKKLNKNIEFKNLSKELFSLRLPLDKVDIRNAQRACHLTGEAFKNILPQVKSCEFEYEVAGLLEGEMLKRTPDGKSFPTIAASGKNATILHYEKYDDQVKPGELLLLDFGLRWKTMHADISRTIPISGKFNFLQKLLYQICLNAQKLVEKKARAGKTIKQLNEICWEYIEADIKTHFLDRGGKMKRSYEKSPHGVSHLMGEMEHDGDPFGDYKDEPMQEGWMISNEPGIYGWFSITKDGKKYDEYLGIRLEDDLLIKKNGCVNFSKNIPREIKEIENMMHSNFISKKT